MKDHRPANGREPSPESPVRLALWSGPRNVSTAMMRAWENRPDTHVIDEPFYAPYLVHTGLPRPDFEDTLARHENDWRKVVGHITGPVPGNKPVFYQKQMAQQLMPHISRDWFPKLRHGFLIRNPREMLASLGEKLGTIRIEDTGLPQQVEIFNFVCETEGNIPPIVDSRDLLENPKAILQLLCKGFGVPFYDSMLEWPAGPRKTDGAWGKYWYHSVERSTGFKPYSPKDIELAPELEALHEECLGYYRILYRHRLATEPVE